MVPSHNIFSIQSKTDFESTALRIFDFQYNNNPVYRQFCIHLGTPKNVSLLSEIPYLPIEFFKSKKVLVGNKNVARHFTSSGTTGNQHSTHYVVDLQMYQQSFQKGFEHFYGNISNYCLLALLPSYLERQGSSLIYMVDDLIKKSGHPESGFYLDDLDSLAQRLGRLDKGGTRIILIGVSFALLELVEKYSFNLQNTIIMETGGMKGRRKELVREALHILLRAGFGVDHIHSEYGMTELLSQAYSQEKGIFRTPPWMSVSSRDTEDPLTGQNFGRTGGINVIDLANLNSCSFIATQDLGKVYEDGSFEVLGRFDQSDIRGCNLMVL